MNHDLIATLLEPFNFLVIDRAFQILQQQDPGVMGCAFVILGSTDLIVRIASDRGQVFADVAAPSKHGEWFDLSLVRHLLHGGNLLEQPDIGTLAELLRSELTNIGDLFSNHNFEATRQRLKTIGTERAKLIIPQLCSNKNVAQK
jgi:hypothetical protein